MNPGNPPRPKTYPSLGAYCPVCLEPCRSATTIHSGGEPTRPPLAGDPTVCIACGEILCFDAPLSGGPLYLRTSTDADYAHWQKQPGLLQTMLLARDAARSFNTYARKVDKGPRRKRRTQ